MNIVIKKIFNFSILLPLFVCACNTNNLNTKPELAINTANNNHNLDNDYYKLPSSFSDNSQAIVSIPGLIPSVDYSFSNAFQIKIEDSKDTENNSQNNDSKEDSENDDSKKKIVINDIILDSSGKSILGQNAIDSIKPDFNNDKDISIEIKGSFPHSMNMDTAAFTFQPPMIMQTQIGELPKFRILLDGLLMNVISVSQTSIKATLNSKFLLDLYLKGLRHLDIINDDLQYTALIKVGDPVNTNVNLTPKITSVEIIRVSENEEKAQKNNDDKNDKDDDKFKIKDGDHDDDDNDNKTIVNLKLKGTNFLVNYRYNYARINGEFCWWHSTSINNDGSFEAIVHVSDPSKLGTTNSISVATPFGFTFKTF